MRVAYTGHEALTFTDYIDLEAGKTLHAEPGGVYDIAPASGRNVLEVPEPWFVRVVLPSLGVWIGVGRELTDEGTPEPELTPDVVPEPDPAPEPDEAQGNPEPAPEPAQF